MSIQEYLNKRIGVISLNIISLIVLSVFLFSSGNTFEVIKIIWLHGEWYYRCISYMNIRP